MTPNQRRIFRLQKLRQVEEQKRTSLLTLTNDAYFLLLDAYRNPDLPQAVRDEVEMLAAAAARSEWGKDTHVEFNHRNFNLHVENFDGRKKVFTPVVDTTIRARNPEY